jgi:hypothetical protein
MGTSQSMTTQVWPKECELTRVTTTEWKMIHAPVLFHSSADVAFFSNLLHSDTKSISSVHTTGSFNRNGSFLLPYLGSHSKNNRGYLEELQVTPKVGLHHLHACGEPSSLLFSAPKMGQNRVWSLS